MRSVSTQWAQTLRQSHKRWVRVSSYYGGTKTGEPPIVDGEVTFDASAPGARRCRIVVPLVDNAGNDWNPGTDREAPLASNGQRLLIESGIYHPDHTLEFVSLGWYVITDAQVDETAGTLTVAGADLWTLLDIPIMRNAVSMRIPQSRLGGVRTSGALDALLYPRLMAQPYPADPSWPVEAQIIPRGTMDVAPPVIAGPNAISLLPGDSRVNAIQSVFQFWGATGRVDDTGALSAYVIAAPPSASDPADVELTDVNGTNPVLVSRAYQSLRDQVYNAVFVTARSPTTGEQTFYTGSQYNTGPLSTQGPLGYRPRFIETTLAASQTDTNQIATQQLARSVMYVLTQSLTCVPNAAIELDDIAYVSTAAGGSFKGRVTQITLPLLSTGPMTLTVSNQTAVETFAALRDGSAIATTTEV